MASVFTEDDTSFTKVLRRGFSKATSRLALREADPRQRVAVPDVLAHTALSASVCVCVCLFVCV